VSEVVDLIGSWRERVGVNRFYLQTLDLTDLDHIELFAAEVAAQLD
jgi:alkanesulfonate monooxygenase